MIEEKTFQIDKFEIEEIFRAYQSRKTDEEIEYVNTKHNGIAGLAKKLRSDLNRGISSHDDDHFERKLAFDDNVRVKDPEKSFCEFVIEALEDTFLRILILSSIFQISVGASPLSENPKKDWIDGLAIVFAVVVIVLTSSITNYSKEKKFRQQKEENFKQIRVEVNRGGQKSSISDQELLVGDIARVEIGMIIPADGIIINGNNILTDESSLTGESDLIKKDSFDGCLAKRRNMQAINEVGSERKSHLPSPILFSGTIVKSGSGWIMILAVGKNSAGGRISENVRQNKNDEEGGKTPLELKLEDVAEDIGKFGLWAAILTLVALLFKLFYSKYLQLMFHTDQMQQYIQNQTLAQNSPYAADNSTQFEAVDSATIWSGLWKDIFSSIILCITIIVVAIPEGLPLAVTLSLSFSVQKMMEDNNLVRRMHACETMGGANYICTDKTGTLTRNAMHVVTFHNNLEEIPVREIDKNHQIDSRLKFTDKYYAKLRDALIYNINIEIDKDGKVIMNSSSKTDFAFYDLLSGLKEDFSKKLDKFTRIDFNSERKKMTTIVPIKDNMCRVYMKGAPEIILPACNSWVNPKSGEITPLTSNELSKLRGVAGELGRRQLRPLAISYKEVNKAAAENYESSPSIDNPGSFTVEESGFSLVGIAGIEDGLRDGVDVAVAECYKAGVNVIMITGDNTEIAYSIAKTAGIILPHEDSIPLTGPEFFKRIGGIVCKTCSLDVMKCNCPRTINQAKAKLGDDKDEEYYEQHLYKEMIHNMEEFQRIIKTLKVLARARPMDKYALVLGLRELDHVVAVTGDGTNDAPALAKADVGFAMGQIGTDVAKDAADIIILDDNFTSIVKAIKWGRNIFDNIRKFIQFQLSVNLAAVLLVFLSSCIGSESPISPIQMLWINLIMDSLGSLALATEPPNDLLLRRKPHSKREYIISSRMWKHIIVQSFFQFLLVFLLYLYAPYYIQETDPSRIYMIDQFENCFGDFPGEIIKFENHNLKHFILDGKKSSWDPLRRIRRNLDPSVCMFFDESLFPPDKKIKNLYAAFKWYTAEYGNTVHMTIIFNSFVLYALFNQINARILDDSLNIFSRIFTNKLFLLITTLEFICQFCIVQYGGLVFKCAVGGLTWNQWMICVGLGATTLVFSFFLKFVNLEAMIEFNYKKFFQKCCCCRRSPKRDKDLQQGLIKASFVSENDDIEKAESKIELANKKVK